MVSLQVQIHSHILRTDVPLQVLLPQPTFGGEPAEKAVAQAFPVVYLLHGLSEDQTAWVRNSAVERLAETRGMAVVMPYLARSFCTDVRNGPKYGQFLEEELPFLIRSMFPVSARPEDTYVAGCDMGGYGALKLALRHPERFAAAASLGGPLDLATLYGIPDEEIQQELASVFGSWEDCVASGHHLPELLEKSVQAGIALPRLFQACGTDDFLLQDNRNFAALAGKLNVGLKYREGAGDHGWACWDALLPHLFDWMFPEMPTQSAG